MSAPATDWLGEIPQARSVGGRPAKDHKGRLRKVHCESCGCIVYASAAALMRSGLPVCGCGVPMALANLRDRAVVEWEQLEEELQGYGIDHYNAVMRELGYRDMVAPKSSQESHGGHQRVCEVNGCHKFSRGPHCPEHVNHRPEVGARVRGI